MITNPTDPIAMLKHDHEEVVKMFNGYKTANHEKKRNLANKISEELALHMEIEEQIFYPKAREISEDTNKLVDQGIKEHNETRKHIREFAAAGNESELDKHVQMTESGVIEHVQKEEKNLFPIAETGLKDDMVSIAGEMIAFKTKNKGQSILEKMKSIAG